MKVYYISPSTIPSRSANLVHVLFMSDALLKLGHKVTLFVHSNEYNSKECRDIIKESHDIDGNEINKVSKYLIDKIREDSKPRCLVLNTYRFASHSKSDDGRDEKEIKSWLSNDPLTVLDKVLSKDFIDETKKAVTKEIDRVVELALDAPFAK